MAERIVVDPITRIEGHLRIEAEIENGVIKDAFSSGTMVRGIETIVKDRDPRDVWAFVGRICGVCTSTHSLTSVRAVENALDIVIPPNAEMVRNIMANVLFMHDHVVHFYHLHALDWVDVVNALKADPAAAAAAAQKLSTWPKSSEGYFKGIQDRIKKFVDSGQLGIFANGYWGHPAYKLTPEQNLIATAHYLEALEWQKEIVKVHAVFGGKNPHPNYLVGGMPASINLNEANAINAERLAFVREKLEEAKRFIDQVYIPDILLIGSVYKDDWGKIGGGVHNHLAFGDFPMNGSDPESYKIPRGIILDRDLTKVHPVDATSPEEIQEYIYHSWYKYTKGDSAGLHPFDGETELEYTGPRPPYKHLDVTDKYSWIKTPRWKDKPMEVGPLSRMLVAYASGKEPQKSLIDDTLKALDLPAEALFSTLGRTAARALESKLNADWALECYDQLIANLKGGDDRMVNNEKWEESSWPKEAKGVGLTEAPRGALAHFAIIENSRIKNYQMVVPTTWNASPRDEKGQLSAYESALVGTPVHDPKLPLEILRTIHSFDPCLACAVHLYDEDGDYVHQMDTF
ncbi:hydrogenase large subunit [Dysgonomonas sp. PFB1-18]|uniref:nickel-dependent hydrogenase large subunit n=1 Tax=unclassified Dysgonomonas TaxID=2630389 RepID=UPI002474DE31|nr:MULTISPECIES: nickel-dependent hydrogenase large subunit [unclassified Dysgonomonas]MDH6309570.1 hydrogenase large subunit [Dysgonomonas sp. PF1-14]MDH6339102.1 hydrogenase large subunit [Dysgonomonas sp. PF1-16]MDH6380612.1 hydrogenase large subunit [Dysgonomonas sp. PFB1-18]MDH6398108.1 hydrogenase large subunit [Dysgonomonas sp. PF1-23]